MTHTQYAKVNDVIESNITGEKFRVVKTLDRTVVYEKGGRLWNIRHGHYTVLGDDFGCIK